MQGCRIQPEIIGLFITAFFSIVNIVFAIINAVNAKRQKHLQRVEVGITLMEKRFNIYCVERDILESIIDYHKPHQSQLNDLCHAHTEASFLFGKEICDHLRKILDLTDQVSEHESISIPDGEGGYEVLKDYQVEEFSIKAAALYAESIDLFGKYIDFSKEGIMNKE